MAERVSPVENELPQKNIQGYIELVRDVFDLHPVEDTIRKHIATARMSRTKYNKANPHMPLPPINPMEIRREVENYSQYREEITEKLNSLDSGQTIILIEDLDTAINSLSSNEAEALRLRYQLDRPGKEKMVLEEVGKAFGVKRERARQVIAKGQRKLRHPSRSRRYRFF